MKILYSNTNVGRKQVFFLKWWEPTKHEQKIIDRGLKMFIDDFKDNYEPMVEEHEVLEAIINLVTKLDSTMWLLKIILIILCISGMLLRNF